MAHKFTKCLLFIPNNLFQQNLTDHDNQSSKLSHNHLFNLHAWGYNLTDQSEQTHSSVSTALIIGFSNVCLGQQNCSCSLKIESNDVVKAEFQNSIEQNFRGFYFQLSSLQSYCLKTDWKSILWIVFDIDSFTFNLHNLINFDNQFQTIQNEYGTIVSQLIKWLNKYSVQLSYSSNRNLIYHRIEDNPSTPWFVTYVFQQWMNLFNKLAKFSKTLTFIQYYLSSSSSLSSSENMHSSTRGSDENNCDQNHFTSFSNFKYRNCIYSTSPNSSLCLIAAIQLLILILCLLTVPHSCDSYQQIHHVNLSAYTPDITMGSSIFPNSKIYVPNDDVSPWLPSELNCKKVPTLGFFYSELEEENVTISSPHISIYELCNYLYTNPNDCWYHIFGRFVDFFTCELTRLLMWLESGKPVGLKINYHLASLMGQFFLYHILAWRSYVTMFIYLFHQFIIYLKFFTNIYTIDQYFMANLITSFCLIFSTIYMIILMDHFYKSSSIINIDYSTTSTIIIICNIFINYLSTIIRLLFCLILSILIDLIELITLHLTSFYIYTTHLLRLQILTISASWRLCRSGCKWNPLRKRVDTIPDMYYDPSECDLDYDDQTFILSNSKIKSNQNVNKNYGMYLDRILITTLLGLAIGLCLCPTTFAIYTTFTLIHLVILIQISLLKWLIWFIMDFPVLAFVNWCLISKSHQNQLVIKIPYGQSKFITFIQLHFTKCSLYQMYDNYHLVTMPIFPKHLNLMKIITNLLTAHEV